MTKQEDLITSLSGTTTFQLSSCQRDDCLIGKWGRMHKAYLEEANPLLLNHLILTGKLHVYLADLNEQAQNRYRIIIRKIAKAEGVSNDLKRRSQWDWIKAMNGIISRIEEIIRSEICST